MIARAHGFVSWPKFVKHVESVVLAGSSVSAFEAAAMAIVSGDLDDGERLLREHPDLIRARSTREHRATLLHYVSANGVEGYRQVSPKNIAGITEVLVAAGADVDADADVYGGGCTTLGLVATSSPPRDAGVQLEVIDVLLRYGARMDLPGSVGNNGALIRGCLANGQPEAASYLVSRGAPLDLVGAAGVGRIDVVQGFFGDDAGGSRTSVSKAAVAEAFAFACIYGQPGVVEFLLQKGFEVDAELRSHGAGHTGLHVAAYHGHLEVVRLLLSHGARVEAIDKTWGTPPLKWALTGWSSEEPADAAPYYEVVAELVAAGANVTPDLLEWERTRADPRCARRSPATGFDSHPAGTLRLAAFQEIRMKLIASVLAAAAIVFLGTSRGASAQTLTRYVKYEAAGRLPGACSRGKRSASCRAACSTAPSRPVARSS